MPEEISIYDRLEKVRQRWNANIEHEYQVDAEYAAIQKEFREKHFINIWLEKDAIDPRIYVTKSSKLER